MITLRRYKKDDAEKIASWTKDEVAFRLWCADRFKKYPLQIDEFNQMYDNTDKNSFFGMIAEDNGECVGHLFFQTLSPHRIKLGLIIVDSARRGMGYGKRMLEAAISYAKNNLKAKTVTLSVFDSNISAYKCYCSLGFKETGNKTVYDFFGEKHNYIELEYIIE